MPTSTPVFFGNTAGSVTSSPATCSLPSITENGVVLAQVTVNGGSSVLPAGPPAGWTQVGATTQASTSHSSMFMVRDVTPADSGAALSVALSGAGRRWVLEGVYIPGGKSAGMVASTIYSVNDASAIYRIPAVTPTSDDNMRVGIGGQRFAGAGTFTFTEPGGGWTEAGENTTNFADSPNYGGWADYLQLVGQNGVAQAQADGTPNHGGSRISISVCFPPIAAAAGPQAGMGFAA